MPGPTGDGRPAGTIATWHWLTSFYWSRSSPWRWPSSPGSECCWLRALECFSTRQVLTHAAGRTRAHET